MSAKQQNQKGLTCR